MNYLNWESLGKYLILSLIAFISPIKWLIVGVGGLIVFDTVAGVYRAYKQGEKITSRKLGHTVSKFLLYNLGVISGYILQLMIGLDFIPIAKIMACAIGLTELKSISESINEVTGIDLFKVVLNYLKRNEDQISKTLTETNEENLKP